MIRLICVLLFGTLVLGNIAPSDVDNDLDGIDPDILDGLDDYDEEAERAKQEAIDRASQNIQYKVQRNGYPLEVHTVQTQDGYILTMHRIPYARSNQYVTNKPVVLLQHGLLCSSNDWIIPGPGKGLAYILADLGYDVWLGNARGNSFSKNHIKYSPKKKDFWDFSWHEIGIYDLPAMIDYALAETGKDSLNYVGHSQGTTAFFVMASERPEYNKKVRAMHALAPVAFMSNIPNPFIRVLAPLISKIGILNKLLGSFEFLPSNKLMSIGGGVLCKDSSIFQPVCSNALFLIVGYDTENLNNTMIPEILDVTPAGASVNQLIHYCQSYSSGKFRQYDYGIVKNLVKYKRISPPEYPLKKVAAPVHLYYSNNDWLAGVKDVQILASKLPNVVFNQMVRFLKFNHLDFLWGLNVYEMLYADLINNIIKNT